MSTETQREAVDLLQELGLKEYEAESFVALARMEKATAKEISEHSEVPRTRVYDAIRILESRGLVEVQHTSPQQFRAVSVTEAVDIIDRQYDAKMSTLRDALADLETIEEAGDDHAHEVWSLTDGDAISTRTDRLIDTAEHEIVLVVGSERFFDDELVEKLRGKLDAGVDVVVGTLTRGLERRVEDELPGAEVFVSGLEWLRPTSDGEDLAIGRLLLVDNQAILVSTFHEEEGTGEEHAIFGSGFTNGLVVVARRLMATGLLGRDDPAGEGTVAGEEGA